MNKTIRFLDALKKEFHNMFIVVDGAPIEEFWEQFDLAYQEAAEQKMHPTLLCVCRRDILDQITSIRESCPIHGTQSG